MPERVVIILVISGVLVTYDVINEFVKGAFGVDSQILTIFLLVLIVPLFSDLVFRTISSITGRK